MLINSSSNLGQSNSDHPPARSNQPIRKKFIGRNPRSIRTISLHHSSPSTTTSTKSSEDLESHKTRQKKSSTKTIIRTAHQIPIEILQNDSLNKTIEQLLPRSYQFEIHKTIHQIIHHRITVVGLQMPEGLLQWSLIISDLIRKFCPECQDVIVLGDVTYGACCVDDFTARALGCQMLVHYGHSCLIPVDQTSIRTLYVFVEIGIDREHLRDTIKANFPQCLEETKRMMGDDDDLNRQPTHSKQLVSKLNHLVIGQDHQPTPTIINLAVVGTVQFVSAVQALKLDLELESSQSEVRPSTRLMIQSTCPQSTDPPLDPHNPRHDHHSLSSIPQSSPNSCRFRVTVPQIKPLSPGEILGCTAPKLSSEIDAILYVGDGRFHLESIMIANPRIPAYRYDPYEKKITYERYDHLKMRAFRHRAIEIASQSLSSSADDQDQYETRESPNRKDWAIVLGTLGRQGSLSVFKSISEGLNTRTNSKKMTVGILISELTTEKLNLFRDSIDVFVQTSCPRLSIDWGHDFFKELPLLNPYESKVCLNQAHRFQLDPLLDHPDPQILDTYPMDFYADESLGDWTPRHGKGRKLSRKQ